VKDMTNKEIADLIEKTGLVLTPSSYDQICEAARRLRELPDLTTPKGNKMKNPSELTNSELTFMLGQITEEYRQKESWSQVIPLVEAMKRIDAKPEPAPDPTPEPEPLTLRGLVEKHECLSRELSWRYHDPKANAPWKWQLSEDDWNCITDAKALTVVLGIVKRKCDERKRPDCWGWGKGIGHEGHRWLVQTLSRDEYHDTELEAIDALLTAMQVGKG
jgi:hypothetical protein